jgi:hypothetical protein
MKKKNIYQINAVLPSLTRGWVCTFQLLMGFASGVFLGSESRGTIEVEVTLRLTVSQPVCLGVGHPFGAHDEILLFFFLMPENCFALRLEAPSLTRGRVCNL